MPRFTHKVPAYRRHASGQAIVTLSGHDHYLGVYGSAVSRLEYERLIGQWLAGGRQLLPDADKGDLTILEMISAFRVHLKDYYRHPDGTPTKEVDSFRHALRPLREVYGRTPAAELGPLALGALQQRMVGFGWSRPYINKQIRRIRSTFKWAVAQELVPPSVYQGLQAVAGLKYGRTNARETEPVQPVSEAVVEETLRHTTPTVAAMIQVQMLTGMRPMEVCLLRGCDLDLTGPVWIYRPERHKMQYCGQKRQVLIGPRAQEVLRPYLQTNLQAYSFSPRRSEAERLAAKHAVRRTPLSCGNRPGTNRSRRPSKSPGEYYDTPSYDRAIAYACDAAFPPPEPLAKRPGETHRQWTARLTKAQQVQLKAWRKQQRWTANRLRHTAATRLRRDFGLDVAQTVLGHRLGSAVTEVYAEANVAKAIAAIERTG